MDNNELLENDDWQSKILLEYMFNKRGPKHEPWGTPYRRWNIFKGVPERIFVVFFQTDKSGTTKVQFHSDPALIFKVSAKYVGRQYQRRHLSLTERGAWHAACSCLSEYHCELSPKLCQSMPCLNKNARVSIFMAANHQLYPAVQEYVVFRKRSSLWTLHYGPHRL